VILVEVRCRVRSCRRLLDTVGDAVGDVPTTETDWTHWGQFEICPKHGEAAGHGNIAAWQERQRRAGKPTDKVRLREWRPWSDLRSAVEEARRTGKTQQHLV
jgi:hypothetical protein